MYLGLGIAFIAVGLLLALFVNTLLGIVLALAGLFAILASFAQSGGTREVIVERERRPTTRTPQSRGVR